VQFTQPVYLANNYNYRPSYALNLKVDFLTHLFVRPSCGHYFYGDWYASNFNDVQYQPWDSYSSHFRGYDPLLAYYGHQRRGQTVDERNRGNQQIRFRHHHKIAGKDLSDMHRKVDQLAKAQRDRKRMEHSGRQPSGKQVVVLKPSGKMPSQKTNHKPAQNSNIANGSTDRRTGYSMSDLMRQRSNQPYRRSQSTRNAQQDKTQLAYPRNRHDSNAIAMRRDGWLNRIKRVVTGKPQPIVQGRTKPVVLS